MGPTRDSQFRHPHILLPAGRQILESLLPDVQQALLRSHGTSFDVLAAMPPFIEDRAPREGDERFITVTARRPVMEYAFATTAGEDLDVRRGVAVTELLTGAQAAKGVPHVTGVRTSDGERLAGELGHRCDGPPFHAAGLAGGGGCRPTAEEAEDSGVTYYSRYFHSATGTVPAYLTGALTPFDSYSLLTLPGDAGTWSVSIYISSRDQALKSLRQPEKWAALVTACPLHAHFLDGNPSPMSSPSAAWSIGTDVTSWTESRS